jgi:Ig-like domain from next to BRCA1 gene
MNTPKKLLPGAILLAAFLLDACGPSASSQVFLNAIDTAVAMTVTAQENSVTPTITASASPYPTSTPVSTPTFTPTASPTPPIYYSNPSYCNDSAFIKDVTIPDGTILAPGQEFEKTWRLQNTGSCTWTPGYLLVFTGGDSLAGYTSEIGQYVYPGRKADVSLSLTAPDAAGTYYGYWTLADQYGNTFGVTFYVELVVAEDTATPTPTATVVPDTPTPTATITPVAPTATSTSTPEPSDTPTPTAVSTATYTPVPTASETPELPTATSTSTPEASDTPTPTAVSTATYTPVPTASATPGAPTATSTSTPEPSDTPTPTPTIMPTHTPRPTSTPRPDK